MCRILLFLLCCVIEQASANSFTFLYPQSTIDQWREPFTEDIGTAFRKDIYPALNSQQKQQVGSVRLFFPDRCPSRICSGDTEPFSYFAGMDTASQPVIIMSIQSLRFWADLSLAYAWLAANGKPVNTPPMYISMLHYQTANRFPGARYPLPLDALGIPEQQARANPRIMRTFQDIFVSGVYFILAHELAHLLYRHPGNGNNVPREVSRRNEAEADEFAARLLAQIGQSPAGMVFLIQAWSSFAPNKLDADYLQRVAEMTHPIDSDRLRSLASAMDRYARQYARRQKNPAWSERMTRQAAAQVSILANTLDARDYDEIRQQIGQRLSLDALRN